MASRYCSRLAGEQHLVAGRHLHLHLLYELETLANVGAQLVDGGELARLLRPLVGQFRQHLPLRFLDHDTERHVLAGLVAEPFR